VRALPLRQYRGQPAFERFDAQFVPRAHQARAFERLGGSNARSTLVRLDFLLIRARDAARGGAPVTTQHIDIVPGPRG